MCLPIQVTAEAGDRPFAASVTTEDISSRGVYFTSEHECRIGSPVELVIGLPREITPEAELRVHCVGRVVRVDRSERQRPRRDQAGRVGIAAVIDRYEFLPWLRQECPA